jgi:hypothetical protein
VVGTAFAGESLVLWGGCVSSGYQNVVMARRERRDLGWSAPVGFSKIATMPTPSISEPFGRVRRSADSQVRSLPFGSR